jgi:hypothetical protein
VIPLDRLPKQFTTVGHMVAAGGKRYRPLRPIAVDDLPTIETLRRAFDRVVDRYNTKHAHRGIGGETPLAAYLQDCANAKQRGDSPRNGRDALALMPVRSAKVSRDGVVHRVGMTNRRFSFEVNGAWLRLGTELEYRADPLLRGLFARVGGHEAFLEPLARWAARQRPAAVAEQQEAIAEQVAEQAKVAQLTADLVSVATTALENAASGLDAEARRVAERADAERADESRAATETIEPKPLDLPPESDFSFE